MNRRDFPLHLAGLAGLLALSGPALAQGAPVEGKDFLRISPPVPMAPTGKVEVVEFFWYGCPHCNALEPSLEAWVKRLPSNVHFERVAATFSPMHSYHARIYYALELMGKVEAFHTKVFAAIHVQHQRLDKDADVAAFFTAQGLDGQKVLQTMKSFTVEGKLRQAKALAQGYKIDGVPTLGIQGRFTTSAAMTGSEPRLYATADMLIAQVAKSLG
ncbi:thiol:disulfide interchange protein DsbA/DsbL [Ideonella dechloratans]|uniref:Thiol:disulfide interchange protein DsbA n=1 Tax=Ideonella dechloratans TaxID=36863 RepID=A0A643F9W7_IDEDE|nr:thiol:disulfide interchange protein DsbA/DsbL [Ideonella dechloratans]KAB0579703.1 thiol:disulfide interchange protein DsbA/DsbL [Ideonella dechloratans]UFU10110.1 thiol:disulfide interchange protein DsbA/DsbL [Ideonella dechloratans]